MNQKILELGCFCYATNNTYFLTAYCCPTPMLNDMPLTIIILLIVLDAFHKCTSLRSHGLQKEFATKYLIIDDVSLRKERLYNYKTRGVFFERRIF